MTALSTGIVDKLKADEGWDLAPVVTQFGWQFEKQFFGKQGGPTAVTEAVVLFGGLEQGVVIPSLSWLVGVRASDGTEIGVGPNVTPAGVALAACRREDLSRRRAQRAGERRRRAVTARHAGEPAHRFQSSALRNDEGASSRGRDSLDRIHIAIEDAARRDHALAVRRHGASDVAAERFVPGPVHIAHPPRPRRSRIRKCPRLTPRKPPEDEVMKWSLFWVQRPIVCRGGPIQGARRRPGRAGR